MNKRSFLICWMVALSMAGGMMLQAQQNVQLQRKDPQKIVDVLVGGAYFTSYYYGTDIEKPVLFPLNTASGITVSRGYPLAPRANERTDHPHHIGMWFNYGDINGLDFWNNSDAIKAEEKPKYGSIRHQEIVSVKSGKAKGTLVVRANWVDINGTVLLKEETEYTFKGDAHTRIIDRKTTLMAQGQRVAMKDNKEGVLGIRVARELELPADKPEIFTDANGIATKVAVLNNEGVTGNFLTSEGKTGNAAWGTRGKWCMMYGTKQGEPVSITIFDHPLNVGYPTFWHARGYGLFAANPLGQEVLSGGKLVLNFALEPKQTVVFRHRIMIHNGKTPTATELDTYAKNFSTED